MENMDLFSPKKVEKQKHGSEGNAADFGEISEHVSSDMKNKNVSAMVPPWEHAPDIARDSIWWIMGRSGDHMEAFKAWFKAQPEQEQAAFTWKHPEPVEWQGFYDSLMAND